MTTSPSTERAPRSPALALWSIGIGIAIVLVATGVGYRMLYQAQYSPAAFVERYLELLSTGRAADAMLVPGVAIDSADLADADIEAHASEALLRTAALTTLTDIELTEHAGADGITEVTARYLAGGQPGTTTFEIESTGWSGLAPAWRFAHTPLAVINLTVQGSMSFRVNGFEMDKRQVSPQGAEADPDAAVPLLVFTPGLYAVSVETPAATASGLAVLADAPLTQVPVAMEAKPTPGFLSIIQQRVDEFLAGCTSQVVLQPTGCPFGLKVQNRIASEPVWTIAEAPKVDVRPLGAQWVIPSVQGVAHIEVEMLSLFDGSTRQRSEDIPFVINGIVTLLPNGTASIVISGPDTE